MAEHIGHGVGAAIQSSVDVTTAAQTRAQRDADKIAKGPRGSKVLFANRQGVGVVLNRHRKAGGFSKFFSHRSACPAWQVVGCVCHAARVIDPASGGDAEGKRFMRSEEHTSELQSLTNLVCRLLLEKKKKKNNN